MDVISNSIFKNTFLLVALSFFSCGNSAVAVKNTGTTTPSSPAVVIQSQIMTGADQIVSYKKLLDNKKIGVVTNQTGLLTNGAHLVDVLLAHEIEVKKIYAPEHGFRGTADAGELVKDGKDSKTGLPIISLYGNNKKPNPAQLKDIDVMVFDLQDVGARFYTYISSLHYIMEACAEQGIELIVLDRPNPIGAAVDGPILEMEHHSFVGMHPIPTLHGMTIGEYAKMINGEKWLAQGVEAKLTVVPCKNYSKNMEYNVMVNPSPNLPNPQSIKLYASLCFFEGTNVSVGRGTDKQFQIYGAPNLKNMPYSFTPMPNNGAKDPMHNGKKCYGEDLSTISFKGGLDLTWLIKAYQNSGDQEKFFNNFFTKLAGTKKLQQQITSGMSAEEIKATWKPGLNAFKKVRAKYLIYN